MKFCEYGPLVVNIMSSLLYCLDMPRCRTFMNNGMPLRYWKEIRYSSYDKLTIIVQSIQGTLIERTGSVQLTSSLR